MEQGDVGVRAGPKERVVRHIGFAERWLVRARQECTEGNLVRGLLTLLLAEAEVQHARDVTLPSQAAVLPRPSALAMIVGATGLAVVLLLALTGFPSKGELVTGGSGGPPVIRFEQSVGSTLALVPAVISSSPETQPAWLPQARSAAPFEASPGGGERVSRVAARRATPAKRGVPPLAKTPGTSRLVSDADLIDLVLAAERSLRGKR